MPRRNRRRGNRRQRSRERTTRRRQNQQRRDRGRRTRRQENRRQRNRRQQSRRGKRRPTSGREKRRDDRPEPAARDDAFPVDVLDRGRTFLVTAELPGLRTQNIDIAAKKDTLQIVADYGDDADGRHRRRGRGRRVASRTIRLPARIDERSVTASYNGGILWVTLKKQRRPKRVE